MGRTYMFECEKCGYHAMVSGGLAEGLDFTAQTILCHECRELQDAIISDASAGGGPAPIQPAAR